MKHYFSSDWYLWHNNILRYDDRPFKDIDHHNRTIIDHYNATVKAEDHFYFLGDFAFTGGQQLLKEVFESLIGHKFFIRGNHDHHQTIKLYEKFGTYLGEQTKIVIDGQDIILNHYAMRVWNRSHKGSWHLYGHSHGHLEHTPWGKSMDVAINMHNYYPLEFQQIKKILDSREIHLAGDHHDNKER